MKTFQTIALSKRYLIVNTNVDFNVNALEFNEISPAVIQIQAEVMRYGYMFDEYCIKYLNSLSKSELDKYAKDVENYLVDAYGDNGMYASLFGNFPYGVMEMNELEFFFGQFIHYLTGADMRNHNTPDDAELKVAYSSCLRDDYKKIEAITMEEFVDLFKRIISAQQSLTAADKDNVKYLCEHYKEIVYDDGTIPGFDVFPTEIPFKETLCILASNLKEEFKYSTITDILRVIAYLSGGDVALPRVPKYSDFTKGTILDDRNLKVQTTWRRAYSPSMYERYRNSIKHSVDSRFDAETAPFKFKHFKRAERKMILGMIEKFLEENSSLAKQNQILEDMKRYLERWLRVGEILHPGEYSKKYPKTAEFFVILRNAGSYIPTYNGKIENARRNGNIEDLLELYSQRPGEFARNLDNLLRNNEDYVGPIMLSFKKILPSISTKMLYELLDHFYLRNTNDKLNNRVVTLKGGREKFTIPSLAPMSEDIQCTIIDALFTELAARFASKGSLEGERYYIDPKLKDIMLPKNMRSMNFAPGQLPQGSKYHLKTDTGILRFYCRWDDPNGSRDLDLSACLMKREDDDRPMFISWCDHNYNSGVNKWWAFSGDVRHRVGKCAEYIDINVSGALLAGYKYLVLTVNDYNGHGFLAENAYCGVMERDQIAKGGETTWAPDTVTLGFRLASPSVNVVAAYINLEDLTMSVIDEDYTGPVVASLNRNQYQSIIKRYANYDRFFNVYSLIQNNIQARDGKVEDMEYTKEELKESIKKLEQLVDFFMNKCKSNPDSDDAVKGLMDAEDYLAQYKYVLSHTIEYDDIARDYTTIFEWMF